MPDSGPAPRATTRMTSPAMGTVAGRQLLARVKQRANNIVVKPPPIPVHAGALVGRQNADTERGRCCLQTETPHSRRATRAVRPGVTAARCLQTGRTGPNVFPPRVSRGEVTRASALLPPREGSTLGRSAPCTQRGVWRSVGGPASTARVIDTTYGARSLSRVRAGRLRRLRSRARARRCRRSS
jgi:hypothetical protein